MFESDDLASLPDATLCHLVDDGRPDAAKTDTADDGRPDVTKTGTAGDGRPDVTETLLIHKKRGVGSGQWVGPGGKVEAGETPRECVVREVREEVCITVEAPEKVGVFVYRSEDWAAVVHVFRASDYAGTPAETEEAAPAWFPVDDLPFEKMWPTDREWLPAVLDGETFRGRFVYRDGDPHEVELETGVTPHIE